MIKKTCLRVFLFGVLAGGVFSPLYAHHGTSVNYEMDRTVLVVGTVTEFRWRNPHSALFLDVTDESGEVSSFAIELPSPTLLSRVGLGWTRHTFKPGDLVEFKVHPSRTGAPVAVGGCADGMCEVLINGEPPGKEY